MKLLIVGPDFHPWSFETSLEALSRRHHIESHRFAWQGATEGDLLGCVRQHRPDWMLGLNLGPVSPATLRQVRQAGTRVAFWYVDCFSPDIEDAVLERVHAADVFFTTAGGLVRHYRARTDTPVHWLVEGAWLPGFPQRLPPYAWEAYRSEVAFVGNLYHVTHDVAAFRRRERLLKQVQSRFGLRVWGPQGHPRARELWGDDYPVTEWPAWHAELVKICRSSDVVLGINHYNCIDRYFSNRTFLTLAAGGFHLTHYVPGLESMFDNHRHLVWYRTEGECLDLIAHYVARPQERQRIAACGQALVRQKYSMARQFSRLLRHLQ
ncbi:MAG TPA: glycosyltransferase [Candidatus Xenobia bacterium]